MAADAEQISLHLIDSSDGRSLQRWTFCESPITIGRDPAANIPLADHYVSRVHVELIHDESGWRLFTRGRNGVFVDGKSIDACQLQHGMTFRLAAVGPQFRCDMLTEGTGQATISFDPNSMILLSLDTKEVSQQADEIASSDYFQELLRKASDIRRQRTKS